MAQYPIDPEQKYKILGAHVYPNPNISIAQSIITPKLKITVYGLTTPSSQHEFEDISGYTYAPHDRYVILTLWKGIIGANDQHVFLLCPGQRFTVETQA